MKAEAMITTLKTLKLHGMADAIGTLAAQSSPAYQQAVPVLEMLLKAESSERDVRSINYQMKAARFPAYRDVTGFNFEQSTVDEALVASLHRCQFLQDAQNVVSWVAQAPARHTWRRQSACRPYSTTDSGCGSSLPLSWSMRWSMKNAWSSKGAWPTG
jgi:DNA replication protein DnaC